jgi:hypothetical protein
LNGLPAVNGLPAIPTEDVYVSTTTSNGHTSRANCDGVVIRQTTLYWCLGGKRCEQKLFYIILSGKPLL